MLSNWDHDRNAEHRLFQEDITLCSNKSSPPDVPAVLARHRWAAVPNVHSQNQICGPNCSRSAACRCNPFATHCSNPLCKSGIPARTRQHQCGRFSIKQGCVLADWKQRQLTAKSSSIKQGEARKQALVTIQFVFLTSVLFVTILVWSLPILAWTMWVVSGCEGLILDKG